MKKILLGIIFMLIFFVHGLAQKNTSGLLERNDIEEKYKWDLSDLYESEEEWDIDYNWIKQNLTKYDQYEGKLDTSSNLLLRRLEFNDSLDSKLNWLRMFSDMHRDVDMKSEKYQKLWSRYSALESEVNIARSFFYPEIISISESVMNGLIAENSNLEGYRHFLNTLLKKQKHTLSPDKEELLAKFSKLDGNPYSVFGKLVYAEIPFPTIKNDKGEEVLLNRSTSWRARSSPDRSYRKRGYELYYGTLKNYHGTLAQNITNLVESKMVNAEVRGYESALEAAFAKYNLPVSIYENLIKSAKANLKPLHRWMSLKKKILEYDTLYLYDNMVSLFSESEHEYSWEEARDMMFESLKPMGDFYVNDIKEAYEKRWVDAFPNIGKETGGYSTGPKGPHPYVKMNWGGKGLDFTTLVHEFGHYVHGYRIMKKQPYIYRDYPPFLGEIASTTAENVSWAYLIDKAETKAEKLYLTGQFIDLVVLYFYTSSMNAEFENELYKNVKKNGSLSAETLSKIYRDLTKTYYGESVTITDFDSYVWAEWPHFYFGYYIYSYATSFSAAIQIAENIRLEGKPAVNRFINFLEAGNSDYPVNVIKKAGVDLRSSTPIESLVKRMNELMDEVEKIHAELTSSPAKI